MVDTTIVESSDFDVAEKYDTLVKQSLAGDSAYIRAKETVLDLVAQGAIDDTQKAEIISNILGSVVNNITSSSMSTAVQWASSEKDFVLKKAELEKQLDILIVEKTLKTSQNTQVLTSNGLAIAEAARMHGVTVVDPITGAVTQTNTGKVYQDELAVIAQTAQINQETSKSIEETARIAAETAHVNANTVKIELEMGRIEAETTLVTQKLNESYAAVHKIVADTYVNFGHYTYGDLASTGVASITQEHDSTAHTTLSDTQQSIAEEQAKGYTYNAWANALTGSASMLGTAIASDYVTDFTETGGIGNTLLVAVQNTATQLQGATLPGTP